MSGIAKLKKDELRIVAEEIGLVVNEGMKKSELRRLIEDSDVFKNDKEAVKSAVEDVLENRNKKSDQDSEIEIERLKIERIKLELQLAQVKPNGNNTSFDQGFKSEPEESLDSLIKSVRTLTIKPPSGRYVVPPDRFCEMALLSPCNEKKEQTRLSAQRRQCSSRQHWTRFNESTALLVGEFGDLVQPNGEPIYTSNSIDNSC
ncbi:uncharacterized protein NPIL_638711 [Nephila pilipes]|uniref:Rho termination factor N-terminal domain-containing protein n=1 Tax=Nephila pilipes TaxID=299642 RepID=A0A8X6NMN3_NEPPI|nr:uncharacterized protein NPIL_638711 [Nephila pilipes]